MVDAADLKSVSIRSVSSSLTMRTQQTLKKIMIFHSIFIKHTHFSIFYLYLEKLNTTCTIVTDYATIGRHTYAPEELKIFDWPEVLDGSLYTESIEEGNRFIEILERLKHKNFGKILKLEPGTWCSVYSDLDNKNTHNTLKKDIIFFIDFETKPDTEYAQWIEEKKNTKRVNFLKRKRRLLEGFFSRRLWKFVDRYRLLEL